MVSLALHNFHVSEPSPSLRSDDDSQPDEIFVMVLFVPMTPDLDSCTKNQQQHGDNQPGEGGGLLWAYMTVLAPES